MSVLTCPEVRELAPELALGILGGAERAEVVLHVNGCARCQAYVSELTEAADAIGGNGDVAVTAPDRARIKGPRGT